MTIGYEGILTSGRRTGEQDLPWTFVSRVCIEKSNLQKEIV